MTKPDKPLVILDRDGVINEDSDAYVKSPAEWKAISGSINAIVNLKKAGFLVAIATNQSGIARGLFDLDTLSQINLKMIKLVQTAGGAIDRIEVCIHGPQDQCCCRKPKPGMIIKILEYFGKVREPVYFVGDSLRDLQAAKNAKIKPVLVKTGKGLATYHQLQQNCLTDVSVFDDLQAFSQALIKNHNQPWL